MHVLRYFAEHSSHHHTLLMDTSKASSPKFIPEKAKVKAIAFFAVFFSLFVLINKLQEAPRHATRLSL